VLDRPCERPIESLSCSKNIVFTGISSRLPPRGVRPIGTASAFQTRGAARHGKDPLRQDNLYDLHNDGIRRPPLNVWRHLDGDPFVVRRDKFSDGGHTVSLKRHRNIADPWRLAAMHVDLVAGLQPATAWPGDPKRETDATA